MPGLAALILAAGGSMRMGKPKQLCQFQGISFLRHTANLAIAAKSSPIIAVVQPRHPAAAELHDLPVIQIENPDWQNGIGTSLRRGITHILQNPPMPARLLIMLCDQPLVSAEHLQSLIASSEKSNKPITVSSNGQTQTPPLVLRSELFPDLLNVKDDPSAKSIWAHKPDQVNHIYNPRACTDIDTPEDYARLTNSIV